MQVQVLDPVVWRHSNRLLSRRHLIGYTGLPPDYAGMQTVCRLMVPAGQCLDPTQVATVDARPCDKCRVQLERHGRDFYERQQQRWAAIARGRRAAEQQEERT